MSSYAVALACEDIDKGSNNIIHWIVSVVGVRPTDLIQLRIYDQADDTRIELNTGVLKKSVSLGEVRGIKNHGETILSVVRLKLQANGYLFRGDVATKPMAAASPVVNTAADPCPPPDMHGNAVPQPKTVAAFFRDVGLTAEQALCVRTELPDADVFLLSCFDRDTLVACGLKQAQINAWMRIAKTLYP